MRTQARLCSIATVAVVLLLSNALLQSCGISSGRLGTPSRPYAGDWIAVLPVPRGLVSGKQPVVHMSTEQGETADSVRLVFRQSQIALFAKRGMSVFEKNAAKSLVADAEFVGGMRALRVRAADMAHAGQLARIGLAGEMSLLALDERADRLVAIGDVRDRTHAQQLLGVASGLRLDLREAVVFMRIPEAFQLAKDTMRFAQPPDRRHNRKAPLAGVFQRSVPDNLAEWAQPVEDRFKAFAENPRNGLAVRGSRPWVAASVFEEPGFSDLFGVPFARLGQWDLDAIREKLDALPAQSPGKFLAGAFTRPNPIQGASQRRGRLTPDQILLFTPARVSLRNWAQTVARELGSPAGKSLDEATTVQVGALVSSPMIQMIAGDAARDAEKNARALEITLVRDRLLADLAEPDAIDENTLSKLAQWEGVSRLDMSRLDDASQKQVEERLRGIRSRAIDQLRPPFARRAEQIDESFASLAEGVTWYRDLSRVFVLPQPDPRIRELTIQVIEKRRRALVQHKNRLVDELLAFYRDLPALSQPSADRARIAAIGSADTYMSRHLGVAGDQANRVVDEIRAVQRQQDRHQAQLLPRSLRPDPYKVLLGSGIGPERAGAERYDAGGSATKPPVANSSIVFQTDTVWGLFHGRFDALGKVDRRPGYESIANLTRQHGGVDVRFRAAYLAWIFESYRRFGQDQLGEPVPVAWTTTEGGRVIKENQRKIWMSKSLFPFYGSSYKLIEAVGTLDSLIEMIAGEEDLGQAFGRLAARSDGSVSLKTRWATPVENDIKRFLDAWPHKSRAQWQMFDNIRRYAAGTRSLQESRNWR